MLEITVRVSISLRNILHIHDIHRIFKVVILYGIILYPQRHGDKTIIIFDREKSILKRTLNSAIRRPLLFYTVNFHIRVYTYTWWVYTQRYIHCPFRGEKRHRIDTVFGHGVVVYYLINPRRGVLYTEHCTHFHRYADN